MHTRSCRHADAKPFRVCAHLIEQEVPYYLRFTGRGLDVEYVCAEKCLDIIDACIACRDKGIDGGSGNAFFGKPEVFDQPRAGLSFEQETIATTSDFVAMAPMPSGERMEWIGITPAGLVFVGPLGRSMTFITTITDLDLGQSITIRVSPRGRFAAFAVTRGLTCVVLDLKTYNITRRLSRDGYCNEHCNYSIAFVERGDRTIAIHSPAWNRLDAIDALTGELLTERGPTSYTRDEERPEHYLDYFHCGLHVSPDGKTIVDNGWVWHPWGYVSAWSIDAWLDGNVWESEDGPTKRTIADLDGFWDRSLAWIDNSRIALLGHSYDMMDAAQIIDVTSGGEIRWFPGPKGDFTFDRVLIAMDAKDGATVWDVETGACWLRAPELRHAIYHPSAKVFCTLPASGSATITRMRGLDSALATGSILELARAIQRDRSWDELDVLGDALETAGCTDEAMLEHCRGGHEGDRCWVIDRLLAEER
jgi:hypothetical protein